MRAQIRGFQHESCQKRINATFRLISSMIYFNVNQDVNPFDVNSLPETDH